TMMGDITLYEEIFSHAVPHIYSTIISTTILSLMILNYNWKLGIAALWVIPVAILIFSLSKKKQRKTIDKWIKSSRLVFDDLQENIEQIEEIKSYNLEEKSIHHFFEKLNDATKIKLETEFVSGISIAFSGILLKLGIVTVAIVGANMMIVGEINILVY
ncbi:ABC transporter ATP-binding protein, partial [Bacteroides pyogenes]